MKKIFALIGFVICLVLLIGLVGMIGANMEMNDVSIIIFSFKNVFLGMLKVSPLLLVLSFLIILYKEVK